MLVRRYAEQFAINKELGKFIAASLASSTGAGMQFIGMSLLLYSMTQSAASIGWLLLVHSIAGILLSPWMGVFIDRWSFKRLCVASDAIRALALGLIPLFAMQGDVPIGIIYATEFILAACDRFHWPSSMGLIRTIIPESQLMRANARLGIANQLGMLIGSAVGGILVAAFSAIIVIYINMFTFALSALLTFLIKGLYAINKSRDTVEKPSVKKDWVEGFMYMKSRPKVISLVIIQIFGYMTLYVCNTLLPVFTERELKVGAAGFGYIEAAWAIGAIVGSYMLVKLMERMKFVSFGRISMLLIGGSLIVFLTSAHLAQAMIGYLLLGFFVVSNRIHNETLIQLEIDVAFIGRVNSMMVMLISYISLVVYLGVGYLGDAISIRWIYLLMSVLVILSPLLEIRFSRARKPMHAQTASVQANAGE
ncbi:major facilitator superfamily MFS_1 [Paenibacillus curdlanolyticus YK9]|uniref:Major facilitator superfamily MFS_1 n=1 Tax=Paenibacillus curdlanolyticus YK9 TaxID=717606 RepID=E0ICX7_9BACL|nr:MFS transporter [Paenibacillus curdlanolyticus]EFM09692.1 major facilitator superfamily MFS_1 [Paenibacillus curdlanolyticus YK9]